uniref:Uncharacterized protein LOC113786096 n=1 Tax=Cicer arietinum TaxID=3827 RepID=A0A3Q7Y9M2_CICAR|nr:uncharacterized protein LOC113786096 [Cicer arietinum]
MTCLYCFKYMRKFLNFKRKDVTIISYWKSYSTKIMLLEYFIIHLHKTQQILMKKMSSIIKSAHDSKVFLDAISNPNVGFPWPPRGSFYLVDSGYPYIRGLLPPYRGERYYAQKYKGQGRQPRSPEELFNYRHSSLRMTIERCFGVLKNRFPILKLMSPYKPSRQRLIVIACCTIHNYIRKWNLPDELFNLTRLSDEGAVEMTMSRNRIRDRMWVHHHN